MSLVAFIMFREALYFLIVAVAACNMLYWSLRVGGARIENTDQQRVLFVSQAGDNNLRNDAMMADCSKKHDALQMVISEICGIYACLCWVEYFCRGEQTPVAVSRSS